MRERELAMMNPAGTSAPAARSKIKIRFFFDMTPVFALKLVNLTAYARNSAAVQDMSSEVVDSNPYSRLMALQRMGIVDNYERIRDYSVAIVVSTIPRLS
jgi:hypothetical protein